MLITWLPHPDYHRSAEMLDRGRLSKQRVDVLRILGKIKSTKVTDDRMVEMWRPYAPSLARYGICICNEWKRRGYKDNTMWKIMRMEPRYIMSASFLPEWIGNVDLHLSHQSNLLRMYPAWYGNIFPTIQDDLPLKWLERK